MAERTLAQDIIDLVGDNPNEFDENKERQLQDLLKPINHEMDINEVKFRTRKGNW